MRYKGIMGRINAAVRKNKGQPGIYAVSLEGRLLFGFADEKSENINEAHDNLRKQGYRGPYIYQKVLDPEKRYIFNAA